MLRDVRVSSATPTRASEPLDRDSTERRGGDAQVAGGHSEAAPSRYREERVQGVARREGHASILQHRGRDSHAALGRAATAPAAEAASAAASATVVYPTSMASPSAAFDLDRFRRAQDHHGSFVSAMAELRAGRKTTHWIWWVFPQVAGLGSSATSVRYAVSGREEASAYLADEVLRSRLVEAVTAVHEQLLGPSKRRNQ